MYSSLHSTKWLENANKQAVPAADIIYQVASRLKNAISLKEAALSHLLAAGPRRLGLGLGFRLILLHLLLGLSLRLGLDAGLLLGLNCWLRLGLSLGPGFHRDHFLDLSAS